MSPAMRPATTCAGICCRTSRCAGQPRLLRAGLVRNWRPDPALAWQSDLDLCLHVLDSHEIHRDDDTWVECRPSAASALDAPAARQEAARCIIAALEHWPNDKLFALQSPPGSPERERELAQCHARLAEHCLRMDETVFGRAHLYSQEAHRQLERARRHDPDNELARTLLPEAQRRLGGDIPLVPTAAATPPDPAIGAFLAWQGKRLLHDIDGEHFARRMQTQWRQRPAFTLLVDGGDAAALAETTASLEDQIYGDWLALAFGGDAAAATARLHVLPENTPAVTALEVVARTGFQDWIVLTPAGARLEPHALFALADAIDRHPQWQLVYADDASNEGMPRFKPNFDPVLLAGTDYLGIVAVAAPALQALAADARPTAGLACAVAWQIADAMGEAAVGHVADVLFRLDATAGRAPGALRDACTAAHFARAQSTVASLAGPLPDSAWVLPAPPAEWPPVTLFVNDPAAAQALANATHYPQLRVAVIPAHVPALAQAIDTAQTDLLLFAHPGLSPTAPEWLQTLVASLLGWQASAIAPAITSDDLLEDAGLILGVGGSLGPMLPGTRAGSSGAGDDTLGRAALPHRVAALAGTCLLMLRSALAAAGGLDTDHGSISGCLADACLKLHASGKALIWTPLAMLRRVAPAPAEAPEAPQAFVNRWLPTLARDPYWNRNLSLQSGAGLAETDLVPRWEPERRDVLRVLALPLPPSGQAEYRVTAPLRMLDNAGLAQVTSACEPVIGKERAPTPVELERLAADTIYAQAAFDDVRLQGLIHAARHNPGIFRVFSLDDRVSDVPQYNASHRAMPPEKVIERMRLALQASQRLVVSTEPLAELYRHDIDDIRIVPNRLEKALWDAVKPALREAAKKPRVGWAGAIQHQGDLALILPVIEALADEVNWIFFGMIPAGCDRYVAEFHPPVKPYAAYPARLGALALDLALAPLEINLFNEAKSNLRLLEYGFFGWPVIATDIAPYRTDNAPVCRLANRPQAWLAAIRERLADRDALRAEGQRLRDWVRSRYLLEDWPDDWLSALTPGSARTVANDAALPEIIVSEAPGDTQGNWQPEIRDGLPRILAYAQTTREHDYRAASPLRALREAGLARTMLVGRPGSSLVSYLPSREIERLAPTSTYWHFIIDDLRLEGLRRCAHDFPDLPRIYSLDDRIGDLPPSHPQAAAFPGDLLDARIREALTHCQRLLVTTQPLADLYGGLVESVQVIPNRLEKALWQGVAPPAQTGTHRRLRVGWAGAEQHHGDLQVIAETVQLLADEVDWVFFGMMPPGCEQYIAEFHPAVPFRQYPAKLASLDLDIALAPLEVNLFNEAKSNLRLLDYGYLGWPVICTDILPYRESDPPVVRVANTTIAWSQAICELAADAGHRRQLGDRLRQWVHRSCLLEDHLDDWYQALSGGFPATPA